MSLTAVVKISIGMSQCSLPGRALSRCQAPPAALSRREQTPLPFLLPSLSPHLTSKCQHISLLIGTISSRGPRANPQHNYDNDNIDQMGSSSAGQEMSNQLHIGILNELTE